VSYRERTPDAELLAAGVLGLAAGVLLGLAASGRGGRRNRQVDELLDELLEAARDGLLSSVRAGPALEQAVLRLRALGERIRRE
jgi:hypothetical protein